MGIGLKEEHDFNLRFCAKKVSTLTLRWLRYELT